MGRNEELDAMSEADKEKDILKSLDEHGCVRLTSRPAVSFWGAAVNALERRGASKWNTGRTTRVSTRGSR